MYKQHTYIYSYHYVHSLPSAVQSGSLTWIHKLNLHFANAERLSLLAMANTNTNPSKYWYIPVHINISCKVYLPCYSINAHVCRVNVRYTHMHKYSYILVNLFTLIASYALLCVCVCLRAQWGHLVNILLTKKAEK